MARRIALLGCALAAVCLAATGIAGDDEKPAAEKKEAKFTAKCPVSGQKAKKEAATAYKEKEVYFCCDKCKAAFEADNTKYTTRANHQLVQTKQYKQAKCPFSGGDLNKDTAIKVAAVTVKFCCNNCKGKAESKKGDEQIALIFSDDAFKKGFVAKKEKKDKKADSDS